MDTTCLNKYDQERDTFFEERKQEIWLKMAIKVKGSGSCSELRK
jgi:hypothetical protein